MKTQKVNLKILGLSLILLFVSNLGFSKEFTKTTSKSFDVNKGATLDINTEFSKVKAHVWDKQKISIEATITVEATSDDKAQDRFKRIQLEIDGKPDKVSILSSIESSFFSKSSNNIEIEFLIYYPANIVLELDMEFGGAFFDDIEGRTDVNVEYGNFNVQKLLNTENEIEINFGKFQASSINKGIVEVAYGGCEIGEANELELHTSFSGDVSIGKMNKLTLKSAYDKVNIGEVNTINGRIEFSGFTMEKLLKSAEMKVSYGSFKIYDIATDFELIDVDSEFCALKFALDPKSNFNFKVDVELGSFNYPKEMVTVTDLQKDITDLMMEGYFGTKAKAKGSMRLSVENASINLTLKN